MILSYLEAYLEDLLCYLTMDSPDLFLMKEYKREMKFNSMQRPTSEFQEQEEEIQEQEEEAKIDIKQKEKQENCKEYCRFKDCSAEASTSRQVTALGGLKAANDDDDDGFKTPTSSDHKIPVIKQCPAAPRKPKSLSSSSSAKRKASSVQRSLQLIDLCLDLEVDHDTLFIDHRPILEELRNMINKKARKDDDP